MMRVEAPTRQREDAAARDTDKLELTGAERCGLCQERHRKTCIVRRSAPGDLRRWVDAIKLGEQGTELKRPTGSACEFCTKSHKGDCALPFTWSSIGRYYNAGRFLRDKLNLRKLPYLEKDDDVVVVVDEEENKKKKKKVKKSAVHRPEPETEPSDPESEEETQGPAKKPKKALKSSSPPLGFVGGSSGAATRAPAAAQPVASSSRLTQSAAPDRPSMSVSPSTLHR